jgi:16S rRNA (cytosine967-C5)-methyltransferase
VTPAARIQAAIGIIDRWNAGPEALDHVLARWGRENRYAGSADRRAIADLVYDAVRRLRSAAWTAGAPDDFSGRNVLIGSLLLDGLDRGALAALFSGAPHAPAPLTEAEAARLGRPLADAPRPVRLDFPDWLAPHLEAVPDAALARMRERAPVFLRVNLLRAGPEAALLALAGDGIAAEPGPLSPTCLRVVGGARLLARSRAFREGLVEPQDAASQAVVDYARPRPGETVLDYCAGAGGKTLALAAAMRGQGTLHAHDIDPARLARLAGRARRAGVSPILHPPGATAGLAGSCDLVLVDAPCSGAGTWARHPDAKWRLAPAALATHTARQDAILDAASRAVRPGGRLVYATCSLLAAENGDRVRAFLARQPEFRAGRPALALTPLDGGDGFFAAELLRRAGRAAAGGRVHI